MLAWKSDVIPERIGFWQGRLSELYAIKDRGLRLKFSRIHVMVAYL